VIIVGTALQAGGHRFDPGTLHSGKCCKSAISLAANDEACARTCSSGTVLERCRVRIHTRGWPRLKWHLRAMIRRRPETLSR